MRVDEIYSHRTVHVQTTVTLQQAARSMRNESTRALLVTEHAAGSSQMVGIATDRDMVVHGLVSRNGYNQTVASEVIARGLLTTHDDVMINRALRSMLSHGLYHLAVVDRQQRLVGMLNLDDIVHAMGGERTLLADTLGRGNVGQSRQHAPSDLIF